MLYVIFIDVIFTNQHLMSRVLCLPEGDTDYYEITLNMLHTALMQKQKDFILLVIGYLISMKLCNLVFIKYSEDKSTMVMYFMVTILAWLFFTLLKYYAAGTVYNGEHLFFDSFMSLYLLLLGEYDIDV